MSGVAHGRAVHSALPVEAPGPPAVRILANGHQLCTFLPLHGVMGSFWSEKTWRSIGSNHALTLPSLVVNRVPLHHISVSFEHR